MPISSFLLPTSHFIDEEPEAHRALHRAYNQSRAEPGPPLAPLRLCLRSQDPVFLMNLCCGHYSPTLFTVFSLKHYCAVRTLTDLPVAHIHIHEAREVT